MISKLTTSALFVLLAMAGTLTLSVSDAAAQNPIPVQDSASTGDADALVTIVAFSDFQCPYCNRAANTLAEVSDNYKPSEVRIVFKHFPLAFHKEADEAARAAIAAQKQGKFWRMHDYLFENQRKFKDGDIDKYLIGVAGFIGLDQARFEKDYNDPAAQKMIDRDMALGSKLGVRGTPHFFINGVRISGAQPLSKFKEVIDAELAASKQLISSKKATRANIYDKRATENYKEPEAPKPSAYKPPAPTVSEVVVDTKKHPVLGNSKKALVTIVIFSDFQCPFCNRAVPTLKKIEDEYGSKVRFVFRHLPLPFHKQAEPAARAAWAAQQQGKFWQMHDLLFERQKDFRNPPDAEFWLSLANELGLDVPKFERDFLSQAAIDAVKEDLAHATKVGARGTPNFFINGVKLVGARPFDQFQTEIDKQIEIANSLKRKDKKLAGEKLYKAAIAHNLKHAPAAPTPPAKPADVLSAKDYKALQDYARKNAPAKGNVKKAKVVIYEFTDLQCPFCNRVVPTIDQIKDEYGDKVAIVSIAKPLPFHKEAEPAARAAYAAHRQGKFWEMRALLFENQKRMKGNPEIFIELASQLGLDLKKFEQDMDDPAIAKRVEEDLAMADKVGVRGTPSFFINDKRLVGAQPLQKFKAVIDDELK